MRVSMGITMLMLTAFVAGCGGSNTGSSSTSAADNRVSIEVNEEGFQPAVVNVKAGQPVTLVVTRKTDRTCATELVMKEHSINQPLPLNQPVEITFTPAASGDLQYACAMDMYKGTVHVD